VRLSQEYVEMSLKAVGIECPKVHAASDVLIDVKEKFSKWFRAELEFLRQSSRALAKKGEVSLYGGGESFLSSEEVISKADAEDTVKRADKTYELYGRLIYSIDLSGP